MQIQKYGEEVYCFLLEMPHIILIIIFWLSYDFEPAAITRKIMG